MEMKFFLIIGLMVLGGLSDSSANFNKNTEK